MKLTSLKHYIFVGCIAAATLGLELIQTRVLSFLYFNNVVYLTVTIVLLGFGISGVLVSLCANRFKQPQYVITLLTIGFLFSPLICLALVSRFPVFFASNWLTIGKLFLSYLTLIIPFLFSGAILGWMFTLHAKAINRLYAIDLACSSAAIAAFALLLWPLGGEWFIWLCCSLILISLFVYSYTVIPKSMLFSIALIFLSILFFCHGHLLGKTPEAYKTLGRETKIGPIKLETTAWTPITRIDLWTPLHPKTIFNMPSTDFKIITQDGDAPTFFLSQTIVNEWARNRHTGKNTRATSLLYYLHEQPAESLVIGVGGGIDMITAKILGARHLTGVEINPATYHLITHTYRDYLAWPNWQQVDIVRAEGRNYIHNKANTYDTIMMSGIDTFSALNSGAYVLSENYLYTVEAIKDYLKALKPNGTMVINRWFFLQPRESLRLSSLYMKAAKELNIPHPDQSIMIIADDYGWSYWASTFIKKTAFTPNEVNKILLRIEANPDLSVIYLPKVFPKEIQAKLEQKIAQTHKENNFARNAYQKLIASSETERVQFMQDYLFRIDPVYDDRPFFFEYYKEKNTSITGDFSYYLSSIRGPTVLYTLLVFCAFLCAGCIIFPLAFFEKRGIQTRGSIGLLGFFACLGFGFMTFEIGAMQLVNLYIGDPTYSLPVILAGILISSGIGSGFSAKFSNLSARQVLTSVLFIIALSIILWILLIRLIQPATMHLSLAARILIIFLSILPVGILLGIPFPTAIREIENKYPRFIGWAWGINGVTSVLASVTAIIIAMNVGFTVTVCSAAVIYLLGITCYRQYWLRSRKI